MRIEARTAQGKQCVSEYTKRAMKASFLPLVSIPMVHGLCVAMFADLDKIFGASAAKNEKLTNLALGILTTPFMVVPVWGAIPAMAYVETVGKSYLKALIQMAEDLPQNG